MSQLRRYRKSLVGKRLKTAFAVQRLLAANNGSMAEVRADFEGAFNKAFRQTTKEVYEPATA